MPKEGSKFAKAVSIIFHIFFQGKEKGEAVSVFFTDFQRGRSVGRALAVGGGGSAWPGGPCLLSCFWFFGGLASLGVVRLGEIWGDRIGLARIGLALLPCHGQRNRKSRNRYFYCCPRTWAWATIGTWEERTPPHPLHSTPTGHDHPADPRPPTVCRRTGQGGSPRSRPGSPRPDRRPRSEGAPMELVLAPVLLLAFPCLAIQLLGS